MVATFRKSARARDAARRHWRCAARCRGSRDRDPFPRGLFRACGIEFHRHDVQLYSQILMVSLLNWTDYLSADQFRTHAHLRQRFVSRWITAQLKTPELQHEAHSTSSSTKSKSRPFRSLDFQAQSTRHGLMSSRIETDFETSGDIFHSLHPKQGSYLLNLPSREPASEARNHTRARSKGCEFSIRNTVEMLKNMKKTRHLKQCLRDVRNAVAPFKIRPIK